MSLIVSDLRLDLPDGISLLHGLSFTVSEGEIAVVRGPSGSGKTTLLKCIAQLIPFQHGKIFFDGKTPSELGIPTWRARVMYVPQRPPAMPGTPMDFVKTVRGYSAQARRKEGFRDPIQIGLSFSLPTPTWAQPWSQLSGGESQRALLAIALSFDPSVLLLDEPTASLDAESAGKVEELLKGRTGVLVTHSDEQEARLGNGPRVWIGPRGAGDENAVDEVV